jgi:hypothetical protein
VLDDYTDSSGTLRVLWPSSRHLSPKLRAFVDFLAHGEVLSELPMAEIASTEPGLPMPV